ncbi:MAG TPA: CDP-2,3-bis-(O-geranylgeranyl)-sn-glycerol synthase [Candidatus Thermoplasmatota archaeon]|nr:CDP-2,3-bis-(O-geranylgeranyl)-sn-glycerol synthase [Candidatus Thermoplasmatota archaeon]
MGIAGDLGMIAATALWLMLPAYLSNMLPVFVGGGAPIDLGRSWRDGKRILGDGKTWRGLLLAPLLAAILTGGLQWLVDHTAWGTSYGFPGWGGWPRWFLLAYLMGLGALTGDAVESFIKRRTGRDRGEKWFPWDQLDFILGSLLFAFLLMPTRFLGLFTPERLIVILLLTPVLHLFVNYLGYRLGLKDVPW